MHNGDENSPLLGKVKIDDHDPISLFAAAVPPDETEQKGEDTEIWWQPVFVCIAKTFDFILYGPKKAKKEVSKDKHWTDAWDLQANMSEIFIRERDSELNCLDGIRALAYLWVLSDHLYESLGNIVPGFSAWMSRMAAQDNVMRLAGGNKGDQGSKSNNNAL